MDVNGIKISKVITLDKNSLNDITEYDIFEEKNSGYIFDNVGENRNTIPIKAFKITDNGKTTHMCYACKRIDTGELGMYDVIENKFIPINNERKTEMKIDNRPTYKVPLYDIRLALARPGNDETEVNFTLSEKNKYDIQLWEVPNRGIHWTKEDFETSIKIYINEFIRDVDNEDLYPFNTVEMLLDYLEERFNKMRDEGLNFNLSSQKAKLRKIFSERDTFKTEGWSRFNAIVFSNTKGKDEIYESSKVIVEKYYTIRLSTIQYLWFKIRHPRIDIYREGK